MSFYLSLTVLSLVIVLTEGSAFVYNGFRNRTLKLDGSARVLKSGILQITDNTHNVVGHAFHPSPIHLTNTSQNQSFSFSTTFVFSIRPEYAEHGGHGFAFVMTPFPDLPGAYAREYLGLLNASTIGNKSNHLFAIEFDTVDNFSPFNESNGNHVGIDINTVVSTVSKEPEMNLKSGKNIQAWIDVLPGAGSSHRVSVFVAFAGAEKPRRPLLSPAIDLRGVVGETVYVGFGGSTGLLCSAHLVLGWSFATNGSAAELDLPSVGGSERGGIRLVIAVSAVGFAMVACVAVVWLVMRRRVRRFDRWAECGPRKFTYTELKDATKNFKELLGSGGFGKVYRGVLSDGQEVAVKRVSQESRQGVREFLAEIVTIGRLRHRNLMRLHGYCRYQRKSELLLVYDYMPNASLDKKLFYNGELRWEQRYSILKGVAAALLYLHEEWEQQVIHRDVKASNVLLDGNLNARLGDFGLARLYDHGKNPQTTKAVGTLGYVAPEVMRTGKPTASSDVYSFGSLLLETVCGRRPVEPRRPDEQMVLLDWVWAFHLRGELLQAADTTLLSGHGPHTTPSVHEQEMELVLKLGLLCLHLLPERRPSMRQVVQILNKDAPLPPLPSRMPTIDHPPPPLGFDYNLDKR